MADKKISQKEYLKKYLSNDPSRKKKKKKEKSFGKPTITIVDDDIDLSALRQATEEDLDSYNLGEDLPQIAGIIDERPAELIAKEDYKSSGKWKTFDDETGRKNEQFLGERGKGSRDFSPARHSRQDVDLSPPRKSKRDTDRSPIRKSRHSSDLSPRRRSKRTPDYSPVRRPKRSPDLSPKRNHPKATHRRESTDLSPRRKPRRSADLSPKHRAKRTPDLSPKRQQKHSPHRKYRKSPDLSPPRKPNRKSHSSPRRRSRSNDRSSGRYSMKSPDLSPKRNVKRGFDESPPPTHKKMMTTIEGKKAGLQNASSLREENDNLRKRDEDMLKKMMEGNRLEDQEARVRTTGRRRHLYEDSKKAVEKQKKEEERKQVYDQWGKGLKQIEDFKERVAAETHEMTKPLARYADDKDLDDHLRNQTNEFADPMAHYFKRKAKGNHSNEPTKPVYKGSYPENRFSIRPGYRWDGVDRSNGYETKWFETQNKKKATAEDAYKYSVEDM